LFWSLPIDVVDFEVCDLHTTGANWVAESTVKRSSAIGCRAGVLCVLVGLSFLATWPSDAFNLTLHDLVTALRDADPSKPIDLSGKDLSFLDLSDLDYKRAHLGGANLLGSDLTGANLSGVDLHSAKLDRTSLARANFAGADLSRASMFDAVGSPSFESPAADAPIFAGANLSG
jgi:uncharacterized protein YjbI with pentapeptide repeats